MIKVFDMNIENLKFINFFKIVRPYQWVKNILVFTPMLMSHQLTINNFIISIKAFIIFSLIASTIYIINDIADIKSDKEHPYKKFRPLAAGLISIYQCKILILLLLLFCGLFLTTTNLNFFLLIIAYFLISNFYTFFFKKYRFIDLLVLSVLYTLRIIAGGLIADISISIWLLSFSIFFFISLASVKRQIELLSLQKFDKEKISGRGYALGHENIINKISILSGCASILVLIFYINSPQVLTLYSSPKILWGICIIMFYWISRIIFIAKKGKIKDDPIVFAINDKISYLCLIFILCIIWLGITI